MQKENRNLYTGLFQYSFDATTDEHHDGPLFVSQFSLDRHDLSVMLKKWAILASRKIICSSEEYKNFMKEVEDESTKLEQIGPNFKNIWRKYLLPGDLIVVKTVPKYNSVNFIDARNTRASYLFYQREYEKFKKLPMITRDMHVRCKEYERLMLYWREKNLKMMQNTADNEAVYTLIMEYDEYFWTHQCTLLSGESINNVLTKWSVALPSSDQYFVEDSKDYKLLSQKIQDSVYELLAVEDLVNVWGTCFTLDKGVCSIHVIKTDENE